LVRSPLVEVVLVARPLRRLLSVPLAVVLVALLGLTGPTAHAYPPTPPSAAEARAMLITLTVESEGAASDYDRDLFPHWSLQEGTCDTREVVLRRDGTDVSVDGSCQPTSGQWYSVYDAVWLDDSSDVQIDHIVPLSEAWVSGAD